MSDKTRIPLADAEHLAFDVTQILKPACMRIEVAGSIRRRKEDIGDIEIVCTPKMEDQQVDLFGGTTPISLEYELVLELIQGYTFEHRLDVNGHKSCGKRFQRLLYKGFALDIFCVIPPAQWGVIMALRTGPAELSKRLVTSRMIDSDNGRLPFGMTVHDGGLYDRDTLIEAPEEEDFFGAIGLPYRQPWERF